jgi:hypothetical protein
LILRGEFVGPGIVVAVGLAVATASAPVGVASEVGDATSFAPQAAMTPARIDPTIARPPTTWVPPKVSARSYPWIRTPIRRPAQRSVTSRFVGGTAPTVRARDRAEATSYSP